MIDISTAPLFISAHRTFVENLVKNETIIIINSWKKKALSLTLFLATHHHLHWAKRSNNFKTDSACHWAIEEGFVRSYSGIKRRRRRKKVSVAEFLFSQCTWLFLPAPYRYPGPVEPKRKTNNGKRTKTNIYLFIAQFARLPVRLPKLQAPLLPYV